MVETFLIKFSSGNCHGTSMIISQNAVNDLVPQLFFFLPSASFSCSSPSRVYLPLGLGPLPNHWSFCVVTPNSSVSLNCFQPYPFAENICFSKCNIFPYQHLDTTNMAMRSGVNLQRINITDKWFCNITHSAVTGSIMVILIYIDFGNDWRNVRYLRVI